MFDICSVPLNRWWLVIRSYEGLRSFCSHKAKQNTSKSSFSYLNVFRILDIRHSKTSTEGGMVGSWSYSNMNIQQLCQGNLHRPEVSGPGGQLRSYGCNQWPREVTGATGSHGKNMGSHGGTGKQRKQWEAMLRGAGPSCERMANH